MKWLIAMVLVLATSANATHIAPPDHSIDQEMINLLQLREEQVEPYLRIIKQQRQILLAIPDSQWQKQRTLYEETFERLKPLLDEAQYSQFTAAVGCLIIERLPLESHLVLE
jgi:hypothetical protein